MGAVGRRRGDGDLLQLLAVPGGAHDPAGVDAGHARAGAGRPARRRPGVAHPAARGRRRPTRPEVAELAGLLREACTRAHPGGAPALRRPRRPALARGAAAASCGTAPPCCASTAATGTSRRWCAAGLSGLEALITYTATGRGFTEAGAKATRGWRDEEWAACCGRLAERGLLDDAGLTDEGKALRARVEAATDAHVGRAVGAPRRRAHRRGCVELGKGSRPHGWPRPARSSSPALAGN